MEKCGLYPYELCRLFVQFVIPAEKRVLFFDFFMIFFIACVSYCFVFERFNLRFGESLCLALKKWNFLVGMVASERDS